METKAKVERPYFDEEMAARLAKSVGKIIKEHHRYNDLEDCIEDAKSVLECDWNEDGFTLAKAFEDKGYSGSAELVYDLDSVSSDARDILAEAEKRWVKENNVKLDLEVGALIVFDAWTKNNEDGEIVKLYPETAQYGVWCESLKKPKKAHYVINKEKVKSVTQVKPNT
jgi:hypothetical protein